MQISLYVLRFRPRRSISLRTCGVLLQKE